MELTPLDIRNQSFRKRGFNGFDPDEVLAFLEQVATGMEKIQRQRTDLNERLKISEERVNYYKLIEKTLQDSVLTLQKTVDDVRANAEKEAELIVAEAKARAIREVESTRRQADDLRKEIETLRQQKTNYFIRIRSLIHAQEELLQAMERDHGEETRSAEKIAAEAMVFRNRRLERQPNRQTGAQSAIQPNSPPPQS